VPWALAHQKPSAYFRLTVLGELRRVLVGGGICFIAVQEGTGEAWERRRRYGSVERLFTRYNTTELAKLLAGSGFRLREQHSISEGSVGWLQFLAVAA